MGLLDPLRPLGLLDPAGFVQTKGTYADAFDRIECPQSPNVCNLIAIHNTFRFERCLCRRLELH